MDTDGDAQFDINEFTNAIVKVFHAYAVTEDGSPAAGEEKSGEEIEAERVQLKKEREQEYVQGGDVDEVERLKLLSQLADCHLYCNGRGSYGHPKAAAIVLATARETAAFLYGTNDKGYAVVCSKSAEACLSASIHALGALARSAARAEKRAKEGEGGGKGEGKVGGKGGMGNRWKKGRRRSVILAPGTGLLAKSSVLLRGRALAPGKEKKESDDDDHDKYMMVDAMVHLNAARLVYKVDPGEQSFDYATQVYRLHY